MTIAILDDGVDEDHPDLAPHLLASVALQGANRDSERGTAVAGIAAGDDNGNGVQGVAFNADILAIQAGSQDPNEPNEVDSQPDIVASGIDAATAQDADIINLSLAFPLPGPLLLRNGRMIAASRSAGADFPG